MALLPCGTLFVALGLVLAPPPALLPAAQPAPAQVSFLGQDRFDDIRNVAQLKELEREIEAVVERVRPSVVLLRTRGRGGGSATGTAVAIGKEGLLATCGHVGMRPGMPVTAVLADGTELKGRTLGQCFDEGVDCGLVQLEMEGRELPTVPVGTTVGLAKGDWLIAIGYTHGPAQASRPPLVRVGRVLLNQDKELIFDAPIDAGDSGGPSFNLRGEVVGLNSRCGRQSWENVATPIDQLTERREDLESQQEAVPGAARTMRRNPPPATQFPSGGSDAGKLAVQRRVRLVETSASAQSSMLRVLSAGRPVAYGVAVDARGLVVTKASQLQPGAELTVENAERDRFAAREVARDVATDLALLRVSLGATERLRAIEWAVDAAVHPGQVLVTPRVFPDNPAMGFAAIESRESESDPMEGPYLGVETRAATRDQLEDAKLEQGVTVIRVRPGTAAEKAGLREGEILYEVESAAVDSPAELRRELQKHRVGDRVQMRVMGMEGIRTVEAMLGMREEAERRMRRGNTTTAISRLSSGLGSVLAHDTITLPEQMGGPVVDLDGRVVGLNIARYDRTSTHAISAARMEEACKRLIQQARQAAESAATPAAR